MPARSMVVVTRALIGATLLGATLLGASLLGACASSAKQTATLTNATSASTSQTRTTSASGTASRDGTRQELGVVDLKPGTGARAASGSCLYVHYTGALPNGQTFETSRTTLASGRANDPIAFELGAGTVMPGWEKGLGGMRVGGIRQLWIPFRLAYGAAGRPPAIPARTDLVFDIELLHVTAALPNSSNAVRAETSKTCPAWSVVSRNR